MNRKQIPFFTTLCLLLLPMCVVFADSASVTLGGKAGWDGLSFTNNITFGSGRFGYRSIMLSTDANRVMPETDALLSFESNQVKDLAKNYTIESLNMDFSSQAVMGDSAGLNRNNNTGFRLRGGKNSLFGKAGLTGSFVIEFWLCPSLSESGEQILNWRSSRTIGAYPVYQVIRASFFNNRIEWVFDNIFGAADTVITEVVLTSVNSIIPREWAHHSLSYDDETGLLEYRINGSIEALRYVTSNGHENGEVLNATLGVPAVIEVCPKYTGLIDDFTIARESFTQRARTIYSVWGGRFESQPIETAGFNSVLRSISAICTKPTETDVAFYVRGGDNFYEWTPEWPEWIPVAPDVPIENVKGKYFQVAADLYPDGAGSRTPSISQITLNYTETPAPLPPATIKTKAGNGYVDLTWLPSVDLSVGGYTVYYGESPGEYMGSVAIEGKSPLDVGNTVSCRLSGLVNGRIYYFAVCAYSALDPRISGVLSKEVFARPLRKVQ